MGNHIFDTSYGRNVSRHLTICLENLQNLQKELNAERMILATQKSKDLKQIDNQLFEEWNKLGQQISNIEVLLETFTKIEQYITDANTASLIYMQKDN